MPRPDWNQRYASGDLPWDTGTPEPILVEAVQAKTIAPGRALEVGCGTGTNARWLAEQGFDVLGVDLSPLAIERARVAELDAGAGACRFEVVDFLAAELDAGPFDFVFDRGCFHTFDDDDVRARFASQVARVLAPSGLWLSLIGSTEGAPRDVGPPRRTARQVIDAIEPVLELVEIQSVYFHRHGDVLPRAWRCLARRREVVAQPSTRRD